MEGLGTANRGRLHNFIDNVGVINPRAQFGIGTYARATTYGLVYSKCGSVRRKCRLLEQKLARRLVRTAGWPIVARTSRRTRESR
jgi:hypothetical protein